jgi:hypothetical protein
MLPSRAEPASPPIPAGHGTALPVGPAGVETASSEFAGGAPVARGPLAHATLDRAALLDLALVLTPFIAAVVMKHTLYIRLGLHSPWVTPVTASAGAMALFLALPTLWGLAWLMLLARALPKPADRPGLLAPGFGVTAGGLLAVALLARVLFGYGMPGLTEDLPRRFWDAEAIATTGSLRAIYELAPNVLKLKYFMWHVGDPTRLSDTGPLAALLDGALASLFAEPLFFKLAALALEAGLAWLLWKRFGEAVALGFLLAPLPLVEIAMNGHTTALFVGLFVAAFTQAQARPAAAGALTGLAALVYPWAFLVAPVWWRADRRRLATGLGVALAVFSLGAWAAFPTLATFGRWLGLVGEPVVFHGPLFTAARALVDAAKSHAWFWNLELAPTTAMWLVAFAVFAPLYEAVLRKAPPDDTADKTGLRATVWMLVLVLLALPNLTPEALIVLLPFAIAARSWAALVWTITSLWAYAAWPALRTTHHWVVPVWVVALELAAPLAVALARSLGAHTGR